MFTGIITNLGKVLSLEIKENHDLLIRISLVNSIKHDPQIGCSIACNGICLTLIKKEENIFSFQASKETQNKTNLKNWKIGDLINLEFSLKIGDELGGHIVLGHVDGLAEIIEITKINDSRKIIFSANPNLMKFIAIKGSIVLDGVSLTINEVFENKFSINLIQHSFENTNFSQAQVGNLVNLEIDVLARYVERQLNSNY